ncbi:Tetratricopeptide-like helical [Penicillium paradoxum]|uniref:Tetratricopeptide-like helical n=1 Tax=Penicillium paradoxum TaxID=176176 RepID=UPI0025497E2E|nr:Tetratricopeptide-like helical [Penicillium paradoxum]KAJ5794381.1 Tetratricopeptide-like helical [Penicillium paradoxum]
MCTITEILILTIHFVVDVDAVYRISLSLFRLPRNGAGIYEWALTSCAKANSRRALVQLVNRYLNLEGVDIHRNTEWIAMIKDLALVDEFPPAILTYVKLLSWRGENAAAAELLEQKILPYIKPTRIRPVPYEDLTMGGAMDSPLRMYGLAIAETQGVEGVKNAMRRAALEFHEPIALTELAIIQLESEDWDLYEQYMSLAAVSAYIPACFYLANFYYRISQGEIPSREERVKKRLEEKSAAKPWTRLFEPLSKWIDRTANKPMDRQTYRKLAMDWYELAFELGKNDAGFILAMLFREDGQMELSRAIYDNVIQQGLPTSVSKKGLLEMESKWNDPTFNPGLPPQLLKMS